MKLTTDGLVPGAEVQGIDARGILVHGDEGQGRTVCLIREGARDADLSQRLYNELKQRSRALLIELPVLDDNNWEFVTEQLRSAITEAAVRQASFIAYGPAATVVLNLYLKEPKVVRTVALLDAACRPHPSYISRAVDWIEERLPLGLPLRLRTAGFDAKPFLHRIRCPVLVLTSPLASPFLCAQAREMSARLPTAWHVELGETDATHLDELLLLFYDVPAKCPQKNIAGRNGGVTAQPSA